MAILPARGPLRGLLDCLEMSDLTLKVERVAASVVDRKGRRSELVFFLHTVSPHLFASETLADRLNDAETEYLPCETDGHTELLRLGSLSYAEIQGQAPEIDRLEEIGATHARVELELDCGDTLAGELIYEAPPTAARVLDLFNSRATRFVLLVNGDRTLFVHRDAITRIRV